LARLQKNVIDYIKHGKASYSQIIQQIQKRWGRSVSKGLLSYYRGSRNGRTKQLCRGNVSQAEWDWLVGLYYADGCKFKDRYHYTVVFTLSIHEKEVIEKLSSILTTLGLRVGLYPRKNKRAVDVKTFSKDFFRNLPHKTEKYSPKLPLAYLAGLFDGDGFIKKYERGEKWVFTQARYPHLAQDVTEITKQYGNATLNIAHHQIVSRKTTYRVLLPKSIRKALLQSEFANYCLRCRFSGRAGRI